MACRGGQAQGTIVGRAPDRSWGRLVSSPGTILSARNFGGTVGLAAWREGAYAPPLRSRRRTIQPLVGGAARRTLGRGAAEEQS